MTTLRANFADLLEPGLREILFNEWDNYPEEFSKIFNVHDSKKRNEKDSGASNFGLPPEKDEGDSIQYTDPTQGYDTTYTHKTYAWGFRVTREMYEDDLYGIINKMPANLGRSFRQRVETQAAALFNSGFGTVGGSYMSGSDGKELFATDHPLLGGGTEQNELTTSADLSPSSLQQAIEDLEDTRDDENLLIMVKPRLLVVPRQLKWTARELLGSNQKPYVANNELNALLDEDLSYFVWHHLTDPDAWFLRADQHYTNFFWRRRLDFGQGNDFDTEDAKYKATMRFSLGWSDWRGWYGSPGA